MDRRGLKISQVETKTQCKSQVFHYTPLLSILIALFAFPFSLKCSQSVSNREPHESRALIDDFYRLILTMKRPGIPPKEMVENMAPLITKSLYDLLRQAGDAEEAYRRKTHASLPALIESFLFYSLFEGADRVVGIKWESRGTFLVELLFARGEERVRWRDRVYLAWEGQRWVVDDIEFLADWAFGDKGRVKETLKNVISVARQIEEDGREPTSFPPRNRSRVDFHPE